jgi:4-hydroxyphenylpyruvate dioxygenase
LRITLNGSASPQTLSSRFLQGFHGAGVQHIALVTANIMATAKKLRELGLPVLPIRLAAQSRYREDLDPGSDMGP